MGTRPLGVDWYRMDPPGWFAGEGWELTPETAGIARASNTRLQQRPITAHVRRRSEPMMAIIAGRDLGPASHPPSIIEVTIDGSRRRSLADRSGKGRHQLLSRAAVAAGHSGRPGNYATLTSTARPNSLGGNAAGSRRAV